jgi:glutamate-1-semialdehyde 2,1-aminomutase
MLSHEKSRALFERAQQVLAGGVSSEFRRFNLPHPLVYTRAFGSHIVDADENDYLDFALSQGPMILGHGHPEVQAHVRLAEEAGQMYAALHQGEIELAELLNRLIPCAELIRFSVTGSEAVQAALRTSRAVTGRARFLRFEGHYHGWLDNVAFGVGGPSLDELGPRERPAGLPWSGGLPLHTRDECIVLPWNDLALVEQTVAIQGPDLAAIITEPVMCNNGCIQPAPGFLQGMRALCDRHGIALIFDEVITGFRIHLGGAQAYYGVIPDLAIFAKAIANGHPLSVLAGRREWMRPIAEGTVIHAGTANAGNASVAAALATIGALERGRVHERLHALGARLADGLRAAARDVGCDAVVQGVGPMQQIAFGSSLPARDYRDLFRYDRARLGQFVYALQERGVRILSRGLWYLSAAHTEGEIDQAVWAARDAMQAL